ncbi:uncharacterized protein DDB_G0282077-like [Melanotaenia boesemani]|uniref:uncharacterized protein DDB_G0282077-like n=1 Tax=Melanotaenia boesemani TaxID=1250792 RepID=UPI001C047398|nr:uncharacterized protein DDB_G0282077-like [Melanotaenia boesemani]
MVMELSGRVSWICLLFGLAAGFPAASPPAAGPRGFSSSQSASPRTWYTDRTVKFPVPSQSGTSSFGSSGSGVFSAGGGSGSGLSAGGGSGSGVFSAEDAALQVFQDLSSLGSNLQDARQMSLGEAWNNNNQVAFGSVAGYPHYAVSHVVHYNSGYQRARDGRTDQKYVDDLSGHIPLPEIHPGQKGGSGSKGQQVQRG